MSTVVNEFILRRTNNINAKHLPPKLVQVCGGQAVLVAAKSMVPRGHGGIFVCFAVLFLPRFD